MLATEVILINLDIQTCEFILPIIDNSLILKAINSGKIKLFGTDFQGPTSLVRFNTCFIGFAGKRQKPFPEHITSLPTDRSWTDIIKVFRYFKALGYLGIQSGRILSEH